MSFDTQKSGQREVVKRDVRDAITANIEFMSEARQRVIAAVADATVRLIEAAVPRREGELGINVNCWGHADDENGLSSYGLVAGYVTQAQLDAEAAEDSQ